MTKTILILGATGGLGGDSAKVFAQNGWVVRVLLRKPEDAIVKLPFLQSLQIFQGDAMNEADVRTAAEGADVILHSVNPPGYQKWRELALPMLVNTVKAAKETGARIIFPGNLYGFHPDQGALLTETTPQAPVTRKGQVRVEMEALLRGAANDGVRTLIIRSPDYFSSNAPSSWFENLMVKRGKPVNTITYPDDLSVGHSWAYLPDLAKAIYKLAELEDTLPGFDVYNFRGYYFDKGSEFVDVIKRVVGKPNAKVNQFSWFPVNLLSPLVPLFRELKEMRYLWKVPHQLDNRKLVALIGEEPQTPVDVAVRDSLAGLGCL